MKPRSVIVRVRRNRRRGATAVEFAVLAPFVFLCIFVALMFVGVLATQNTLTASVRVGGRLASMRSVTSKQAVIAAISQRLQRGGVNPDLVTVTVKPDVLSDLDPRSEVTVTASMPMENSTWLKWGTFLSDTNVSAKITYLRE